MSAIGKVFRSLSVAAVSAIVSALPAAAETCGTDSRAPTAVVELRQYKIFPHKRDEMIALFEREFVESQEEVGARLVGQFRDQHDPNRFTWIREFANMDMRERALSAFYFGPVWKAHRNEANPLLDDNDNVLLLRPAAAGLDFNNAYSKPRAPNGASPAPAGVIFVNIHYLWKDPAQEFTRFFLEQVRPQLEAAGVPVIGAFVPERTPNNFPRLVVRQAENVFVWFTRVPNSEGYRAAMSRAMARNEWAHVIAPRLEEFEERPTQVLELAPTPRSALR